MDAGTLGLTEVFKLQVVWFFIQVDALFVRELPVIALFELLRARSVVSEPVVLLGMICGALVSR